MRYSALQIVCDEAAWQGEKEMLNTNFIDIGKGSTPGAYALKDHAPWIDIVNSEWEHFAAKVETRDKDEWRRIHRASIYVEPSTNTTRRRLVVFAFDVRSEWNY